MFSMATAMQLPSAGTGLKEQYTYEQLMEEVVFCKKRPSRREVLF